jgi:hypothetical protein
MKHEDPPAAAAQKILAQPDAGLDRLEAAKSELRRVVSDAEHDIEELLARKKIELSAATPVAELDKKIDALEKRERESGRRAEIARIILAEVETRIAAAREEERAAKRQAVYDEARALHTAASIRVKEFLEKIAPEACEVMATYAASERRTLEANRNLPPGCEPIRSIEDERQGDLQPPKVTERRFQVFMHGSDRIGEVGKVEAHHAGNGVWSVCLPSRSVQGDRVVSNCTIADFVEVITERYEPARLESLSTALRVPSFFPTETPRGRVERRVMPAVPALAAE